MGVHPGRHSRAERDELVRDRRALAAARTQGAQAMTGGGLIGVAHLPPQTAPYKIEPLSDGAIAKPIVVACKACVRLVTQHVESTS
jgi:hypothetical protein